MDEVFAGPGRLGASCQAQHQRGAAGAASIPFPRQEQKLAGRERAPRCCQHARAACPRGRSGSGELRGLTGAPGAAPGPAPCGISGPAPCGTPAPLQPRGPGRLQRLSHHGKGSTGETPAGPARLRTSQAAAATAPQPAPLSPPYVLSWLKLAKSRWPLPASPLCPAKFMAGQPSPPPDRRGGGREGRGSTCGRLRPSLSRGRRGRADPAASPPGPCLRGGRRSGPAPAPSRPPYGRRACAGAAVAGGARCEAKQGPPRSALDGRPVARPGSPARARPRCPQAERGHRAPVTVATTLLSRWPQRSRHGHAPAVPVFSARAVPLSATGCPRGSADERAEGPDLRKKEKIKKKSWGFSGVGGLRAASSV